MHDSKSYLTCCDLLCSNCNHDGYSKEEYIYPYLHKLIVTCLECNIKTEYIRFYIDYKYYICFISDYNRFVELLLDFINYNDIGYTRTVLFDNLPKQLQTIEVKLLLKIT